MKTPEVSVISLEPPVTSLQTLLEGATVALGIGSLPNPLHTMVCGLLSGEGHPLSLACCLLLSSTLFQNRSSVATLSFAWPQDNFSTVTAL